MKKQTTILVASKGKFNGETLYHGTSLKRALKILKGMKMKAKGSHIYFAISKKEAARWAEALHPGLQKKAIVEVNLPKGLVSNVYGSRTFYGKTLKLRHVRVEELR